MIHHDFDWLGYFWDIGWNKPPPSRECFMDVSNGCSVAQFWPLHPSSSSSSAAASSSGSALHLTSHWGWKKLVGHNSMKNPYFFGGHTASNTLPQVISEGTFHKNWYTGQTWYGHWTFRHKQKWYLPGLPGHVDPWWFHVFPPVMIHAEPNWALPALRPTVHLWQICGVYISVFLHTNGLKSKLDNSWWSCMFLIIF